MFNLTGTFCILGRCPATYTESQDIVVHYNIQPWWMGKGSESPQEALLMLFPEVHCSVSGGDRRFTSISVKSFWKTSTVRALVFHIAWNWGFSTCFWKLNLCGSPTVFLFFLLSSSSPRPILQGLSLTAKSRRSQNMHPTSFLLLILGVNPQ